MILPLFKIFPILWWQNTTPIYKLSIYFLHAPIQVHTYINSLWKLDHFELIAYGTGGRHCQTRFRYKRVKFLAWVAKKPLEFPERENKESWKPRLLNCKADVFERDRKVLLVPNRRSRTNNANDSLPWLTDLQKQSSYNLGNNTEVCHVIFSVLKSQVCSKPYICTMNILPEFWSCIHAFFLQI